MTIIDRRSLITRGAAVVGAAAVTTIPAAAISAAAIKPKEPTSRGTMKLPTRDRPITELSFVNDYWVRPVDWKRGHVFRIFWNVEASGSYFADCDKGQAMGEEFLTWLIDNYDHQGFPGWSILGWVAQDMPQKRTGLEVGFLSYVGKMATCGHYLATDRTPVPQPTEA